MKKAEKAELWWTISVLLLAVSFCLLLNQAVDPALDAIVRSRAPLWVVVLFWGLTLVAGLRSYLLEGEQDVRKILRKKGRI